MNRKLVLTGTEVRRVLARGGARSALVDQESRIYVESPDYENADDPRTEPTPYRERTYWMTVYRSPSLTRSNESAVQFPYVGEQLTLHYYEEGERSTAMWGYAVVVETMHRDRAQRRRGVTRGVRLKPFVGAVY